MREEVRQDASQKRFGATASVADASVEFAQPIGLFDPTFFQPVELDALEENERSTLVDLVVHLHEAVQGLPREHEPL